jgi:WD40 repeat protein
VWNLLLALFVAVFAGALPAQQAPPSRLVAVIPLPNVQGRIDHFAIDPKAQRLFMSALGNNTVEVFNLRTNKRFHTITGLHEPQGVTYAPNSNKIFVANGEDGKVRVFDGTNYKLVSTLDFGSDADDTRYDAETRRVYVGFGDGGIGVLDSMTGKLLGEIKVPAHPEAFEVEKGGGRIYINIPEARHRRPLAYEGVSVEFSHGARRERPSAFRRDAPPGPVPRSRHGKRPDHRAPRCGRRLG